MPHYISSLGRYKDSRGVVKTPHRTKAGYTTITIQNKTYKTHRVVAIAFWTPAPTRPDPSQPHKPRPGRRPAREPRVGHPGREHPALARDQPRPQVERAEAIEARQGPDGRVGRAVDAVPAGPRGRARAPGQAG